ncbi:class II SORL domain-containing protein [Acidobacteriota bacterium]
MEDKMCNNDLFCGVNSAQSKDISEMSDLEKKHTPVIEAPGAVKKGESFDVTVTVGKLLTHPNENGHFIEWIELYSGDTFLARLDLVPRLTSPTASFTVSLDHEHSLVAKTRCNMHGVWQSAPTEISVE